MKIPIIGKPLEYTLKVTGLWPEQFNVVGPILTGSALITTLPFQFWSVFELIDNPIMYIDVLNDLAMEVLLLTKIIILWFNKRFVPYYITMYNVISLNFKVNLV